ncbi:glycosyltransferase family 2 protein [Xanthobacter sp. KR7-65]|uniref:glycosyltransferase family 2 protein n=1 Tax=Xanthobacter sp. KR7-65 TaxID=3156612 RepID=UPI0032B3398A
MPVVSVVMPVYNVEAYVADAIRSVLAQTFTDFELIVVDDGSTDASAAIIAGFDDLRLRVIRQTNRGLAGARNTGIRAAAGRYIALLDSDDLWTPDKLDAHVRHLDRAPHVGVSYSQSDFIDDSGRRLGLRQAPKLTDVDLLDVLTRNPVGNGSAPVLRRAALDEIAEPIARDGRIEPAYFDETFRQSEDIECWVRIALRTQWRFAGIGRPLTLYRVNSGGLSANLDRQLASWERMIAKAARYAPETIRRHAPLARAYQYRYLARRAVRMRDRTKALPLMVAALRSDPAILWQDPGRTLTTLVAAGMLSGIPAAVYARLESAAMAITPTARGAA